MKKWYIVRFWATIIASTKSFCVKRSHFFRLNVVFRCNTPHTDKQLKEIWEFGHPCVSSLSDNELMVHKQAPCAKIGGKSVQNRGQSVILSGENHHLPYTIIGGDLTCFILDIIFFNRNVWYQYALQRFAQIKLI